MHSSANIRIAILDPDMDHVPNPTAKIAAGTSKKYCGESNNN